MSSDEGVDANLGNLNIEGRLPNVEGSEADIVDDDNSNENDPLGQIIDDLVNGSEVESLNSDAQAALKATLEAI